MDKTNEVACKEETTKGIIIDHPKSDAYAIMIERINITDKQREIHSETPINTKTGDNQTDVQSDLLNDSTELII